MVTGGGEIRTRCDTGSCVAIERINGIVRVWSTRNPGRWVDFDAGEWAAHEEALQVTPEVRAVLDAARALVHVAEGGPAEAAALEALVHAVDVLPWSATP